jgi:hypothetical protein
VDVGKEDVGAGVSLRKVIFIHWREGKALLSGIRTVFKASCLVREEAGIHLSLQQCLLHS